MIASLMNAHRQLDVLLGEVMSHGDELCAWVMGDALRRLVTPVSHRRWPRRFQTFPKVQGFRGLFFDSCIFIEMARFSGS